MKTLPFYKMAFSTIIALTSLPIMAQPNTAGIAPTMRVELTTAIHQCQCL